MAVHPSAVVEDGATFGDGVEVGPFCHVERGAVIGAGTVLHSHVSVLSGAHVGEGCTLHKGATVGGAPQILGVRPDETCTAIIGAGTELREHATVHAGSPGHGGETRLGERCLLMVGAHVGHDSQIGDACVLTNGVQIAGHVAMGDNVWAGGLAAVHQFSRIGTGAFLTGGAIVTQDVPPHCVARGSPASLSGLNAVGLKRRGASPAELRALRQAYRAVFNGAGLFSDRLSRLDPDDLEGPAKQFAEWMRQNGTRAVMKSE